MQEKLLIWDIDGTLIDCQGVGRRAMDIAFKKLFNIEEGFKNIKMAGRLDWHIVRDALKENNLIDVEVGYFLKEYGKVLKIEINKSNCGTVLPGIREILDETKSDPNIFHILGTGNCEMGARLKLEYFGLNDYFPTGGFGDEDIERWKLIKKAIDNARNYYNINFQSSNIYVIGDTPMDIKSGKIAGVKTIAVATGRFNYDELAEYLPDHVFHNFQDFKCFLNVIK